MARRTSLPGFDSLPLLLQAEEVAQLIRVSLRSGEIRALDWASIDWSRRKLTVERSEDRGHVTLPKHNKIRQVPMTKRLRSPSIQI